MHPGLKRFKAEDDNGLERLDFLTEGVGWFHAEMCLAQEIFQYHGGRLDDAGLARDSALLSRKHFNAAIEKRRESKKGAQSRTANEVLQPGDGSGDAKSNDEKPKDEKSKVPTGKRVSRISHHDMDELIFHTFEAVFSHVGSNSHM